MSTIGWLIAAVIGLGLYFMPTLVAYRRDHPQFTAIMVLNLLAGWTFIGWVAALVWALVTQRPVELSGR